MAKIKRQKPIITIKRSCDAPPEVKENPFYDAEFWGRANSPDDIYLPDSDETISFAMAAHEIGHLVDGGGGDDARLDNFEAARAEEQRAWDSGWKYLQNYLPEYYRERPEVALEIYQAFGRIKNLFMRAVDLSKDMYLEKGTLDNLNCEEIEKILKEKREEFYSERGEEFKRMFKKIKNEKIGIKLDWDKFVVAVTKAVGDIINENKKSKR